VYLKKEKSVVWFLLNNPVCLGSGGRPTNQLHLKNILKLIVKLEADEDK